MTQPRKTTTGPEALAGTRPLSARSVIASTLLGTVPPRLPSRLLVRSGELFGIAEGTTRVALSRMVAAGELEAEDGGYRLAGHLLDRQARQQASRQARRRPWDGSWELAVVAVERRSAAERAELREAMRRRKLAELREGVWLRPDNLDPDRSPEAAAVVAEQCQRFTARPGPAPAVAGAASRSPAAPSRAGRTRPGGIVADLGVDVGADAAGLAARLWDLDGWAATAAALRDEVVRALPLLEDPSTDALAPTFVLSAEVLRHLLADPLLPPELLPDDWPGAELRDRYDAFDAAFKARWRAWFRQQR